MNVWLVDGGAFDGVIDSELATRNSGAPDHLRPLFDSDDHIHLSAAWQHAMDEAIDLALLLEGYWGHQRARTSP